ncbi:serine/threonine-protein kinase PLK4-like isoform X2 [Rhagoletis pomonella]|uniref:serine/threonine-protein kinase PLK4-like isoform X2 n=1 Tax=Rhagoletis pomonella TaxID=28610 RepID=UPI0017842915|nr:serine/threonine-protein kinase PLK4-like isoform X2 [Rhagoletis pomonella]
MKFTDYEVLHLLGKGGFASVYKARSTRTNEMVAIKMIDKQLIQRAGLANRVRQEVEIHSRLKHPSVLELYTFFQDENYVYLVLELAHNGELNRYMKQQMGRSMTEEEAASILRQVVSGLLYLHSHQIMHRDISLSNLLLSKDMHVKIADFGLATQLKRPDEKHMTMCGTPNYISPEVVTRATHGLPADVWGLGCMFYTLLAGHPPFDTDAVQSTLTKVVKSDFQMPQHLSYDAQDLIERLLKKNPSERITLEQVLQHPFMVRREQRYGTAAGSAADNNKIQNNNCISTNQQKYYQHQQSAASCDSGIITFASSNSSSSRTAALQRSRSMEKYPTRGALERIHEHHPQHQYQADFTPLKAAHSYNSLGSGFMEPHEPRPVHTSTPQSDSMELDWQSNGSSKYKNLPSTPNYSITNHFPLPKPVVENNETNFTTGGTDYLPQNAKHPGGREKLVHYSNVAEIPEQKNTDERLSVPPLNTDRLLPTRYKTKNAIMSILSGGEVAIEFIKYKSRLREERITDVCWISQNGLRITIYQPDPGRGLPISEEPPPMLTGDSSTVYTYNNLPSKHWKKYIYASRFVNLVKAKTPKVTFFSAQAKCHLMESMEDFEVFFYTGAKVTKSPTQGLRVYDKHGRLLQNDEESVARNLLQHQEECLKHCQAICSALQLVQTSGNCCFPAVVGRRPSELDVMQGQCITTAMRDTTNLIYLTPKSQQGSINFSIDTMSLGLRSGSNFSNASSQQSMGLQQQQQQEQIMAAQPNVPIRKINIPGIGIATELSHGIIQIQYPDGGHVSVIPANQGGGITFTQTSGLSTHFSTQDDLPFVVREKLAHLPQVERQLKQAPLLSSNGRYGQPKQQNYAHERMQVVTTLRTPNACAKYSTTTTAAARDTQQHVMKYFR